MNKWGWGVGMRVSAALALSGLLASEANATSFDLSLPTANHALLEAGRDADFFQPTVEGTVESGMFGCVRNNGRKFHEGIDIKCLQRDRRGEPIDPVSAAADGRVAFVNSKPSLSNYGRYIVLEHRWDGVQVFTLYAHLRDVDRGLRVGQAVTRGQVIATLGRSTNTREGISRDRAHLHFEVNFMLNPKFYLWYPRRDPKAPPFGNFNGKNLIGIDPAALLRAYAKDPKLDFHDYIGRQTIAFTLLAPRAFAWLSLHPEQIHRAEGAEFVAYEIGVSTWGVPVAVWQRMARDLTESQQTALRRGAVVLNRVNEREIERRSCERLVERSARGWRMTERGQEWAELLTYTP